MVLGARIQIKVTILSFGTKFAKKSVVSLENKKVNITTEFCIFELV